MSVRFPSRNLGDTIAKAAVGSAAAFVDEGTGIALSLGEIEGRAARFGGAMAERFAVGDRVGLLGTNGADFIIAYLGLMRAGLVPVPINYRLPAATIAHILSDSACRLVLGDAEFSSSVPEGTRFVAFGSATHRRYLEAELGAVFRPEPGDLCEILYTSGSTGLPKGVPLDHAGQVWALEVFLGTLTDEPERTIIAAPTYHMNGLFFTTVALAAGWRTLSMPRFDARAYLEIAARERVTMVSGIPTMLAMMARETDLLALLDLSSVRNVIIGSAPLTNALIERTKAIFPNASVRNSYGTTESGPAMFGPHPKGLARPPLSIGYPYPGTEWKLLDGSPEEGRLLTRTPAVLKEYLNLPQVTANKLNDGWYDTGDIVRRDADGWFYFVGRADDMFVCGGENVYPGEVEKLLERHPAVLQAAVIAVPDEIKGMVPVAFVVPVGGETLDPDALKAFTLEHGPAYAHPRRIAVLDGLPVGGTHKVDRKALEKLAETMAGDLARR